ncbi:hypothetical protein FRC08_005374 [Ceratobasidium sp. 394]|nr:hypothetical protein FRC08_005374 [Ceratobasidium sp. 394]
MIFPKCLEGRHILDLSRLRTRQAQTADEVQNRKGDAEPASPDLPPPNSLLSNQYKFPGMSIEQGLYYIQTLDNPDHFVGTGPVPPIYPPYPAPLRSLREGFKDVFEVIPKGGDKYQLTHKALRLHVGCDNDMNIVKLLPQESKPMTWAIDRGNGEGSFRIKLPDSDKYWTIPNDDDWIRLEGANGSPQQEFRFLRLDA